MILHFKPLIIFLLGGELNLDDENPVFFPPLSADKGWRCCKAREEEMRGCRNGRLALFYVYLLPKFWLLIDGLCIMDHSEFLDSTCSR